MNGRFQAKAGSEGGACRSRKARNQHQNEGKETRMPRKKESEFGGTGGGFTAYASRIPSRLTHPPVKSCAQRGLMSRQEAREAISPRQAAPRQAQTRPMASGRGS